MRTEWLLMQQHIRKSSRMFAHCEMSKGLLNIDHFENARSRRLIQLDTSFFCVAEQRKR